MTYHSVVSPDRRGADADDEHLLWSTSDSSGGIRSPLALPPTCTHPRSPWGRTPHSPGRTVPTSGPFLPFRPPSTASAIGDWQASGVNGCTPESDTFSTVYDERAATYYRDRVRLATVNRRVECDYDVPDYPNGTPRGQYLLNEEDSCSTSTGRFVRSAEPRRDSRGDRHGRVDFPRRVQRHWEPCRRRRDGYRLSASSVRGVERALSAARK